MSSAMPLGSGQPPSARCKTIAARSPSLPEIFYRPECCTQIHAVDVGRHVLDVRHLGDDAVFAAEDLDRVVAVADSTLVERALDAGVSTAGLIREQSRQRFGRPKVAIEKRREDARQ
jgi:hypothetical protein